MQENLILGIFTSNTIKMSISIVFTNIVYFNEAGTDRQCPFKTHVPGQKVQIKSKGAVFCLIHFCVNNCINW
jgi:hypothetical protein